MKYLVKFNDGPVVREELIKCDITQPTKDFFADRIITSNEPMGISPDDVVSFEPIPNVGQKIIEDTEWANEDRINNIGQNGNDGLHYNDGQYCWVIYVDDYELGTGNIHGINLSPQKNSKFIGFKKGTTDHPISDSDFANLHANEFTWIPLKPNENVNHPAHYNKHKSGIECIDIIEHMGYSLGSAIKYIWRCDEKNDAIEDLEKAVWLINREIDKRKKEQS